MTVVAWDGKTLAADTSCVSGIVKYHSRKIWNLPEGLLGCAGSATRANEFAEWFKEGRNPQMFGSLLILIYLF